MPHAEQCAGNGNNRCGGKVRGGKGGETVLLHHVCHRTIHKTLSETDLARNYATVEALRGHPELRRFFDWVGKRPAGWRGKVR